MATDADMSNAGEQDQAEIYDEEVSLGDNNDSTDLDIAPDVYDVTHARGDEDVDGDDDALDADEEDDELLDELGSTGEDEDDLDDDDDVDALDADDLEDTGLNVDDPDDPDTVDGVAALQATEADLTDMDELKLENNAGGAGVGRVSDYESDTLSDQDLADLDYDDAGPARKGGSDVETATGAGGGSTPDHARDDDAAGALDPDDIDPSHHDHPDRISDRLDEGLEETFPGSDPVSVKHIT